MDQYTSNTQEHKEDFLVILLSTVMLYETSVQRRWSKEKWDGTYASFPSLEYPMFNRGGRVPLERLMEYLLMGSLQEQQRKILVSVSISI